MFNGAAIGRAAELDFRVFGTTVDTLDGGVVLSVGSAIMAPQVFEKSISCVNNLRLQDNRAIVHGHTIYVVDIQDGGIGTGPLANRRRTIRRIISVSAKAFHAWAARCITCKWTTSRFCNNLYHLLK